MRVVRLDLKAFGPFTDVQLDFSAPGPCLHIVWGQNEAGKTSALRGLTQWLFGMPRQSQDAFRHPVEQLRVGGVLEDGEGALLECLRRKGAARSLRDADDRKLLDPNQLTSLLGGIDQSEFQMRFGINYEQLVAGGLEMVRGGGQLSEVLFSAGAGLRQLSSVREQLENEAGELFKRGGSRQTIATAVKRWTELTKDARSKQLSRTQWTELETALQKAEDRKTKNDELCARLETELGSLKRLVDATVPLARRRRLLDELRPLSGLPALSDDFPRRRETLTRQSLEIRSTSLQLKRQIESLQQALDEIRFDAWLLDFQPRIERLNEQLGSFTSAGDDKPQLEARVAQLQREAQRQLNEMSGQHAEMLQCAQISQPQRSHLRKLAEAYAALETERQFVTDELSDLQGQLEQLQPVHELSFTADDLQILQRQLDSIKSSGDVDTVWQRSESQKRHLQDQLQTRLAALPFWSGSAEDFAKLQLPSRVAVEQAERQWSARLDAVRRERETLVREQQRVRSAEQGLQRLELEQQVVTEEDLNAARAARDEVWTQIVRAWEWLVRGELDKQQRADGEQELSELLGGFQGTLARSDELADRLRREARRVADKASLVSDREAACQAVDVHRRELERLEQEQQKWDAAWRREWRELSNDPGTPPEMLAWLSARATILEQLDACHRQAVDSADRAADRDRLRERLLALAARLVELTEQTVPVTVPVSGAATTSLEPQDTQDWIACCSQQLQHLGQFCESVRQIQHQRAEALRRLAQRQRDQADVVARCEQWQQQWDAAVTALGLDHKVPIPHALQLLEAWEVYQQQRRDIDQLLQRIDDISRYRQSFESEVTAFREGWPGQPQSETLRQLGDADAETVVRASWRAMKEAIEADSRAKNFRSQLQQSRQQLAANEAELQSIEAGLQSLCQETQCSSVDQLLDCQQRALRRDDLQRQLEQVETDLALLAAGQTFEALEQEVQQVDREQLLRQMSEVKQKLKELEELRGDLREHLGELKTRKRSWHGDSTAAQLQQQSEEVLASIAAAAEQFVTLQLASNVLGCAMERYRQRHQGPVLALAGKWFERLTAGSYRELSTDYRADGSEVVVAVRRDDGLTVHVEAMSDGTRDQLFLALRLGGLEHHLEHRRPVPFIVDDVLVHFDDQRAAAALHALAHFAEHTQVILFTHHRHLVELARAELPPERINVQQLKREGR